MILNTTELLATTMNELPAEIRSILEAHFFDNASAHKLQRHRQIKRRDVEAAIQAGLAIMRSAMRDQGINWISEII